MTKTEYEVLLLPSFEFIVTNVYEEMVDKNMMQIVEVAEIPFQNYFMREELRMTGLIWLDLNIKSSENDKYKKKFEQKF